ncbi:glycosyl transferase [Lentzea sp. NBRC 105346]|uniref:nucleotide disphospho-sugar-binding domain-containing protein n=1 Tax=Lentzea sp. NBRC 105346 TaxID=3032205 RepID=UPI0024A607C2|nr:nucleotide disphospho-sugar-binding domain-containing protein [Lentzea sp. NBRC 105346]GLZ30784.1 glycosyl transferase [Lentzea sp. NBRC 105346]
MKVLFSAPAGVGHCLPLVPLAWAMRTAGHDVVLATTGRGAAGLDAVLSCGLPVVDVAPSADVDRVFGRFTSDPGFRATTRQARSPGDLAFAATVFAELAALMRDGLLAFAQTWGPDVVVHTPLDGAGPLVAAKLDVPAVQHGMSFAETTRTGFLIASAMGESWRPPVLSLDVTPPSLRLAEGLGRSMRYVPPSGGRMPVLDDRPRIALTFGTVLPSLPQLDFGDYEVVIAGTQTAAGARTLGWVPLGSLLARCSAVIHHGGAGTTLTALALGVPQLLLPQGADHFVNASAVVRSGAGVVGGDVSAVLEPQVREAAARVAQEIASLPPPSSFVSTVEEL